MPGMQSAQYRLAVQIDCHNGHMSQVRAEKLPAMLPMRVTPKCSLRSFPAFLRGHQRIIGSAIPLRLKTIGGSPVRCSITSRRIIE